MKIKVGDRNEVDAFLENQSQTYTCGSDLSELASLIPVSKMCLRPHCPTYSGLLTLSCLHSIDEKVYKLDQHKRTCFQCGDDSLTPVVPNQFPLCTTCHEKGWPKKAFTVIVKKVYSIRVKVGNDGQAVEEEADEVHINNDNSNDDNDDNDNNDNDDNVVHDDDENNVINSDDVNDTDSDSNVAESDLVIGSKKRNQRSKKTSDNSLVCRSDVEFLQMHGSSEFSSLPCNDFSNRELLRKQENKAHNKKSNK